MVKERKTRNFCWCIVSGCDMRGSAARQNKQPLKRPKGFNVCSGCAGMTSDDNDRPELVGSGLPMEMKGISEKKDLLEMQLDVRQELGVVQPELGDFIACIIAGWPGRKLALAKEPTKPTCRCITYLP